MKKSFNTIITILAVPSCITKKDKWAINGSQNFIYYKILQFYTI